MCGSPPGFQRACTDILSFVSLIGLGCTPLGLQLSLFYRWDNWGSARLESFSDVTQRGMIWVQFCLTLEQTFHPLAGGRWVPARGHPSQGLEEASTGQEVEGQRGLLWIGCGACGSQRPPGSPNSHIYRARGLKCVSSIRFPPFLTPWRSCTFEALHL